MAWRWIVVVGAGTVIIVGLGLLPFTCMHRGLAEHRRREVLAEVSAGYASWRPDHPAGACPDRVDDLFAPAVEVRARTRGDPWTAERRDAELAHLRAVFRGSAPTITCARSREGHPYAIVAADGHRPAWDDLVAANPDLWGNDGAPLGGDGDTP